VAVTAAPATAPAPARTAEGRADQGDEEEQEEEPAQEAEEPEAVTEAPAVVPGDRITGRHDDVAVLGEACGEPGIVGGDAEPDRSSDQDDEEEDASDGATVHGNAVLTFGAAARPSGRAIALLMPIVDCRCEGAVSQSGRLRGDRDR